MNLITYPNHVLNQPAVFFDFAKLDAKAITRDMINIMSAFNGIGLAANQVNLLAQIIVIAPQRLQNKDPFAIINPVVLETSLDSVNAHEGCLSFPDLWLKIDRPKWIKVKYFDTEQKSNVQIFEDIDARCVLHEMDHLNGICFVDKVSKLKLDIARKKQRKLQHGRA